MNILPNNNNNNNKSVLPWQPKEKGPPSDLGSQG